MSIRARWLAFAALALLISPSRADTEEASHWEPVARAFAAGTQLPPIAVEGADFEFYDRLQKLADGPPPCASKKRRERYKSSIVRACFVLRTKKAPSLDKLLSLTDAIADVYLRKIPDAEACKAAKAGKAPSPADEAAEIAVLTEDHSRRAAKTAEETATGLAADSRGVSESASTGPDLITDGRLPDIERVLAEAESFVALINKPLLQLTQSDWDWIARRIPELHADMSVLEIYFDAAAEQEKKAKGLKGKKDKAKVKAFLDAYKKLKKKAAALAKAVSSIDLEARAKALPKLQEGTEKVNAELALFAQQGDRLEALQAALAELDAVFDEAGFSAKEKVKAIKDLQDRVAEGDVQVVDGEDGQARLEHTDGAAPKADDDARRRRTRQRRLDMALSAALAQVVGASSGVKEKADREFFADAEADMAESRTRPLLALLDAWAAKDSGFSDLAADLRAHDAKLDAIYAIDDDKKRAAKYEKWLDEQRRLVEKADAKIRRYANEHPELDDEKDEAQLQAAAAYVESKSREATFYQSWLLSKTAAPGTVFTPEELGAEFLAAWVEPLGLKAGKIKRVEIDTLKSLVDRVVTTGYRIHSSDGSSLFVSYGGALTQVATKDGTTLTAEQNGGKVYKDIVVPALKSRQKGIWDESGKMLDVTETREAGYEGMIGETKLVFGAGLKWFVDDKLVYYEQEWTPEGGGRHYEKYDRKKEEHISIDHLDGGARLVTRSGLFSDGDIRPEGLTYLLDSSNKAIFNPIPNVDWVVAVYENEEKLLAKAAPQRVMMDISHLADLARPESRRESAEGLADILIELMKWPKKNKAPLTAAFLHRTKNMGRRYENLKFYVNGDEIGFQYECLDCVQSPGLRIEPAEFGVGIELSDKYRPQYSLAFKRAIALDAEGKPYGADRQDMGAGALKEWEYNADGSITAYSVTLDGYEYPLSGKETVKIYPLAIRYTMAQDETLKQVFQGRLSGGVEIVLEKGWLTSSLEWTSKLWGVRHISHVASRVAGGVYHGIKSGVQTAIGSVSGSGTYKLCSLAEDYRGRVFHSEALTEKFLERIDGDEYFKKTIVDGAFESCAKDMAGSGYTRDTLGKKDYKELVEKPCERVANSDEGRLRYLEYYCSGNQVASEGGTAGAVLGGLDAAGEMGANIAVFVPAVTGVTGLLGRAASFSRAAAVAEGATTAVVAGGRTVQVAATGASYYLHGAMMAQMGLGTLEGLAAIGEGIAEQSAVKFTNGLASTIVNAAGFRLGAGKGKGKGKKDRASEAVELADAYSVLGLEPGASPAAVKKAYRRLARENHPDHAPKQADAQAAAKLKMQEISAARDAIMKHLERTGTKPDETEAPEEAPQLTDGKPEVADVGTMKGSDAVDAVLRFFGLKKKKKAPEPPAAEPAAAPVDVVEANRAALTGPDFKSVSATESIGGNAGSGSLAVNAAVDSSGRIIQIGNIQHLRPEVRSKLESGEYVTVTFKVDVQGRIQKIREAAKAKRPIEKAGADIVDVYGLDKLSPEAQKAIRDAVEKANVPPVADAEAVKAVKSAISLISELIGSGQKNDAKAIQESAMRAVELETANGEPVGTRVAGNFSSDVIATQKHNDCAIRATFNMPAMGPIRDALFQDYERYLALAEKITNESLRDKGTNGENIRRIMNALGFDVLWERMPTDATALAARVHANPGSLYAAIDATIPTPRKGKTVPNHGVSIDLAYREDGPWTFVVSDPRFESPQLHAFAKLVAMGAVTLRLERKINPDTKKPYTDAELVENAVRLSNEKADQAAPARTGFWGRLVAKFIQDKPAPAEKITIKDGAAQDLPQGKLWKAVRSEPDPVGGGRFLTAEGPAKTDKGEADLRLIVQDYPGLAKALDITIVEDGVRYPDAAGLNARLAAYRGTSVGKLPFKFVDYKGADGTGGEASPREYLELIARGEVPISAGGTHHFHDVSVHAVGWIAMPEGLARFLRAEAGRMLKLADDAAFGPTAARKKFMDYRMKEMSGFIDNGTAGIVTNKSKNSAIRILAANHMRSIADEFTASIEERGLDADVAKRYQTGGVDDRVDGWAAQVASRIKKWKDATP